ncbi:MAG TPA: hypothetical protein DDY59_08970 [Lachnospiraceae bacterium]|nr:hypothetical protein [Lachnospiraceae bacterium]HCA70335.1 hypothetical protein [Lachnospiraceae bacterium]
MKVGISKNIAKEWVIQRGNKVEGFLGAYFAGSIAEMQEEDELPRFSDIDIMVVVLADEAPLKLGKFVYNGVMLEVTFLSWNQISSVENVLVSHHLANSLRSDTIITDPTGCIHKIQSEVSQHFAEKKWVRRRCEHVRNSIENSLKRYNTSVPYHELVTTWLFPTGITTHVLLLAALRNPTVRRRYVAVREVLLEYGHADFYEKLLALLGCAHLTSQRVEEHLDELAKTFDAAVIVAKTPFFFSTDITTIARPIVIEGSRELIQSGYHREAIFWMVATFSRCHKILEADAPLELQQVYAPSFRNLMLDLGFDSTEDFTRRVEEVIRFLPSLWEVTEDILSKNPAIVTK